MLVPVGAEALLLLAREEEVAQFRYIPAVIFADRRKQVGCGRGERIRRLGYFTQKKEGGGANYTGWIIKIWLCTLLKLKSSG